MNVIGLISGTSVDGIDAAVVRIEGAPPQLSADLLSFTVVPFTPEQQSQIFEIFDPATGSVDKLCALNFAVGEWFARAALEAIRAAGLAPEQIDLIGSHGQTAYHRVGASEPVKSTLQIGEPAVISERSGITTIADFRVADVAAGGQGAPMVSYTDWLLLRRPDRVRAVQNIGGIANVTYLPTEENPEGVISFDSGPGNMLIDDAVRRLTGGAQGFDEGGRIAARGKANAALLSELMSHPYLAEPLPKTTGREQFGAFFGEQVWERAAALRMAGEDLVATVTAYTAASIADSYRRFLPGPPDEVIVGGGGASNPTLLRMLQEYVAPAQVLRQEDLGYSSDAKEAVAFAILAHESLHGRAGNLPSCTFARHRTVLGKIIPGKNYLDLLRRVAPC